MAYLPGNAVVALFNMQQFLFAVRQTSTEIHSQGSQHIRHLSVGVCRIILRSRAVERAARSPSDTDLWAKTALTDESISPALHSHPGQHVGAR